MLSLTYDHISTYIFKFLKANFECLLSSRPSKHLWNQRSRQTSMTKKFLGAANLMWPVPLKRCYKQRLLLLLLLSRFSHVYSVRPHRQQPTRLLHPWDFPGKNIGVGCHCLLQKAKAAAPKAIISLSSEPAVAGFFSNLIIFNWKIIASQYCVGFCHTSTWISHRYIYIYPLSSEPPSHLPPLPTPLGCYRALVWVPWVVDKIPIGHLFYIW